MPLDEELRFVKTQIDHHARTAAWHGSNGRYEKEKRHKNLCNKFVGLSAKLKEIQEKAPSLEEISIKPLGKNVGGRLGDLSDVPEHIRKQLVTVQVDELEQQILSVIGEEFGGSASIDEILVGLWRKYKIDDKDRDFLARKIYRMVRSSSIFSVPKRKGIYALKAPEIIGNAEENAEKPAEVEKKAHNNFEELQKNIAAFRKHIAPGAGQ